MFDDKRKKRIRVVWAVISLLVILSMILWSVGIALV